jgi:serine acetyltransferase
MLYKLVVDYIMGIYIPPSVDIGPGFRVFHGVGIVIHPGVVIGQNCTIRQNVTIGVRDEADCCAPRLGDRVDIGASALILGPIVIGDDVAIGAGAVVVESVSNRMVAVGVPASSRPRRGFPPLGRESGT